MKPKRGIDDLPKPKRQQRDLLDWANRAALSAVVFLVGAWLLGMAAVSVLRPPEYGLSLPRQQTAQAQISHTPTVTLTPPPVTYGLSERFSAATAAPNTDYQRITPTPSSTPHKWG